MDTSLTDTAYTSCHVSYTDPGIWNRSPFYCYFSRRTGHIDAVDLKRAYVERHTFTGIVPVFLHQHRSDKSGRRFENVENPTDDMNMHLTGATYTDNEDDSTDDFPDDLPETVILNTCPV